jgi:hypothetical protein
MLPGAGVDPGRDAAATLDEVVLQLPANIDDLEVSRA